MDTQKPPCYFATCSSLAGVQARKGTQMEMQTHALKPRLSFWQLWNMSFGFFGIQFGLALQNVNTSRIFATLGTSMDDLALVWLAAPVTGLLVQPVIGYLGDNTWHPRWGRRRPFFFLGAVLATTALFLMPNSVAVWMAVAMLWLMDASINISMEPFRVIHISRSRRTYETRFS